MSKGWKSVSISLDQEGALDKCFKLEGKLQERGVSFDTGCGFGFRDWELDFSLEGATPAECMKLLDEAELVYEVRDVPDDVLED